jgi:alpha-glucoside transport system permease protein
MTTAEATAGTPPVSRRRAGRLARAVTSGPAAIVILIVGALWLIPSVGLLAASFRPVEAQETGWWNLLSTPSEFTIQNYVALFEGVGEPANLAIAAVAAILGCLAAIGIGWASLASGRARWVALAVSIAAALAVVFELWFLGGLAALIVALLGLPALAIAARGALENRTYGRLTMLSLLAVLTLVIASIPPASGMLGALRNSVLITVPSSVLLVLIAAGAAYAFAWTKFLGRDVLFLIVVGLLVVPLQIGLIPVASLYGATGLFGTIPGVVLFHVAFGLPFAVFLLRNFFIGIPHELLEAARMDGASEWRVFSRVVLPLGIPAIASLLIFQFLWVWNDLLVALVFAGSDARPLTVAIQQQLRLFGGNIDIIAPGAYIQMIVPLIVFFAFQRYFVQGLLAGSQR